jgi:hypothetical protein
MLFAEHILQPKSSGPIDIHRASLVPAFHALSPIFLSLYYYHLNPDFYVRIMVMTSFLMPDFLQLVKERESRSLVLVAWWFSLAGLIPQGWWVGSKVGNVVRAIERVIDGGDNEIAKRVLGGARNVVDIFEERGREEAARSVFEGWCGVRWEEGPLRAKEWESAEALDVDVDMDIPGFDSFQSGFMV